ncbi:DUF748 domain-containing protein [Desulforhopalus sp. IMCC35007]|uniref:DUF748 domain-containing protein n=1 Tax=Desulforhopalus sp. IMCC35007 TaxID=2569543 RepID=UPI0010ADAF6A|nr:DUF748 domain-containing protein [Desulforhopalus sp. IMCC35007]TKB09390.1 DUF748 domain-containing protein [Desulforhopalus sp. IMCC35007]
MSDLFGNISIEPDGSPSKPKPSPKKPSIPQKKKKSQPPRENRPKKRSGKQSGKRPKNLRFLWAIIPAGIVLLYSIIGFFAVPYYLSTAIPQQIKDKYNFTLTPGKVKFNPFAFTLTVQNSAVTDDKDHPVFAFDSLELDLAPIQLLRMDFVCHHLKLTAPSLFINRSTDGTYNIHSLLPDFASKDNGLGMMSFSELPFFFSLNNISLTKGSVIFEDQPTNKTHNIKDLELQIPTLSNIPFQVDNYMSPHFSANINGSPVTFTGQAAIDKTSSNLHPSQMSWALKDISLQDYVSYLPFNLPFSINKGITDGTINIEFKDQKTQEDKLSIFFDLHVAEAQLETKEKTFQVASPQIKLAGSFVPVTKVLTIKDLQLNSPEFISQSQEFTKDLLRILPQKNKEESQPIPAAEPLLVALNNVQFENGSLVQRGKAGNTSTDQKWTGLSFQLSNYVSQSAKTSVTTDSTMVINGQKADKTDIFSYSAVFSSPTTLAGELEIQNIFSADVFALLVPDSNQIKTEGKGELKGELVIATDSANTTPLFSFNNTDVTLRGFKFSHKDQPFFTAEAISFTGMKKRPESFNLGNISFENAKTLYTRNSVPAFITDFTSGKHSFNSLQYQGDITITSKTTKKNFHLENAEIVISDKDETSHGKSIKLSSLAKSGQQVEATGSATISPFQLRLNAQFQNIRSIDLAPLISENTFLSKTLSTVSGKGVFTFPKTTFVGDVNLHDGTIDQNGQDGFSWSELNCQSINFSAQPYHLGIGAVTFIKPQFSLTVQQADTNIPSAIFKVLRSYLNKTADKSSDQKKIIISATDIQEISLSDGQFTISDARLTPPWNSKIENLNGTVSEIHSATSAANSPFSFTGTMDGSGFTWQGSFNPLKETTTDKYQFTLTKYPLSNFTSQLTSIPDINAKAGSLDLTLNSEWQNGALQYSCQSWLSNLSPAQNDSDSALPLALMRDKDGTVKIDIESSASVTPSDATLFDGLVRTFKTQIVKGNLSPLLLANGDFSDLIDNDFISFKPGQFMLTDQGRTNLTRYGALLLAHPHIKFLLSGGLYLDEDKQSLRTELQKNEKQRVEKENEKLYQKWLEKKKEFEESLNEKQVAGNTQGLITETDIPSKVLSAFRPLLPEPVVIYDEMLFDLADKRLEIIKQHFVTQLSLEKGRVDISHPANRKLAQYQEDKGVHITILPLQ